MDRFRISHDDGAGRFHFEVRLFDTVEEMRRHHDRSVLLSFGDAHSGFANDSLAMSCPVQVIHFGEDGSEQYDPRLGVILLNREHLSTRVVAHEVVHAALTFYRSRRVPRGLGRADFGGGSTDDMKREERFAHTYDSLFGQMVRKLYARGHWS